MASQITNYQCPACTGPLQFAGNSGKLECEYCGSSFTVQEIEALFEEKEDAAIEAAAEAAAEEAAEIEEQIDSDGEYETSGDYWDLEGEGLKAYNCPSCGAELILDETTAATSCPYCGNPSIIPGVFSQTLKPDCLIPFKLSKDDAVRALKNYYKGKKLLPKAFADQNHIEEIKGVYVPFWLFDGQADADMQFHGTRVYTSIRGDYQFTTTEHYRVRRAGTVDFNMIPVDASSKMPDNHMDAVEPFDYSEMVDFSTAYLPGYMANKYDVSVEECAKRADERAINSAVSMVQQTASGYATCVLEAKRVNVRRGGVKYALLPVWMLSTRWRGQNYLFAMNGQTGKLIGDLPVDMGRFWGWFAKIALPIAAVLAFLLY